MSESSSATRREDEDDDRSSIRWIDRVERSLSRARRQRRSETRERGDSSLDNASRRTREDGGEDDDGGGDDGGDARERDARDGGDARGGTRVDARRENACERARG